MIIWNTNLLLEKESVMTVGIMGVIYGEQRGGQGIVKSTLLSRDEKWLNKKLS